MWEAIEVVLSAGGKQWHETLPFLVGFLFVLVELLVRLVRGRQPLFDIPALGYMFSEGIAICIVPIYGFGLMFNSQLAADVASKNEKTLATAMFVAFATLLLHVMNRWLSSGHTDE